MENQLLLPDSIKRDLPSMVISELAKMPAIKQQEFIEEFKRKSKSSFLAYVLWFFLGLHYAYLGKWGLQILYWFTGAGFFIWAIIDLFRIPRLVRDYNKDTATNVFRNLKSIS